MKNKISKVSIVASVLLLTGLTSVVMADSTSSPVEVSQNLPWINLTVPYETTVHELAGLYYSDTNDYAIIYNANRGVIPKSLRVRKGMNIMIPVTDKFTDQPELLGWN